MILTPDRLSDQELGQRLRTARRVAGFTQAEAAEAIEVARTTLVAIEQGGRRVRTRELQKLAFLYDTSVNALLRRGAVHLDLVPQFRRLPHCADEAAEEAARLLTSLVSAEVELEDCLGVERHRNYPRERPILPGDVRAHAEQHAQELRNWLGLGAGPVKNVVPLVELDLGIRVYVRRLDSPVSGLLAYDDAVGACMLLNANHPPSRRAFTVAHELGHFISTRRKPVVLRTDRTPSSREEKYADHFASAFLMPARAVAQRFAELTAGHSHLTRRIVVFLAHFFQVSREAMVHRLEELGLARDGTWEWFQAHGGISNQQAEEALGAAPGEDDDGDSHRAPVPLRLGLLVSEAWRRGFYSEGQLAQLLRIHRIDLRKLLADAEADRQEENEFVRLSG